jgi:large conductance mechanosensitive channel
MWREFKAFMVKENVLALAIAVVLGAAMNKLVTAVVNDFIMPVVAVVTPAGDWRAATLDVGRVSFLVGDFFGVLLDFLIVAFVVWRISKAFIKTKPPADKPATRECPFCLSTIDSRATRCSNCTATVEKVA